MRLSPLAILLGAAACAVVPVMEPPEPPRLEGSVPAIGRQLDLEVEGRGTPVRLQGVTGRVTAVCVLGEGEGDGAPAEAPEPMPTAPEAAAPAEAPAEAGAIAEAEEPPEPAAAEAAGTADANRVDADEAAPAAEAAPGTRLPQLAPPARQVLGACTDALSTLRDRISVVALTTDAALDLDRLPLRTFRDPGGKALEESLDLEPVSQVIVVDARGRVAEILAPGQAGRLRTAVERLVR